MARLRERTLSGTALLLGALLSPACGGDDSKEMNSGNVGQGDDDASMGSQVETEKEPMTRIPTFGNGPKDAGADANLADAAADGSTDESTGKPGGFDIPSEGLLLLLRADQGVTAEASGAFEWRDLSGHMRDAIQELPEYAPALEGIANWQLPAVVFDGVDDHLELPAGFSNFSEGVSIFSVAQFDEDQACSPLFEASNGREINDLHLGRFEDAMLYEVAETYITAGDAPLKEAMLWSAIHDAEGALQMRIDGNQVGTAEVPLPVTIKRGLVYLGKSLYEGCPTLRGGIAALIVYDRALSPSEVLQVESALQAFAKL